MLQLASLSHDGESSSASYKRRLLLSTAIQLLSDMQTVRNTSFEDAVGQNASQLPDGSVVPSPGSRIGALSLTQEAMSGFSDSLRAGTSRPLLPLLETMIVMLGGECSDSPVARAESDSSLSCGGFSCDGAESSPILRCWERGESASASVARVRRRWLQTTASNCGSGLSAPNTTGAGTSSGAIVSAAPPASTCNAVAVNSTTLLMAAIVGAITSTAQSSAAIQVGCMIGSPIPPSLTEDLRP